MKRISSTTIVIVIALLALVAFQFVRTRPAPTPRVFDEDVRLQEAINSAKDDGRVVFAVATATWCPPCQSYKRNGLADPKVASWLADHAIPVYIDVDQQRGEAQALGVSGIPATFVIRDGAVVASRTGAIGGGELLGWLEEVKGGGAQ